MYEIKNIDWDKYLERKQAFFIPGAFIRPYGSLLREATGFGFNHQLHTYQGDTGIFYRSSKEMQAADKYYLDLVKADDPRLKVWRDKGMVKLIQ
jgi:hypothetical protein